MNLCVDCKYHVEGALKSIHWCSRPEWRDPIDGAYMSCNRARGSMYFCTYSGSKWEKKPEVVSEPSQSTLWQRIKTQLLKTS